MHTVFIENVYIYQNLSGEMEVNRGPGDVWNKRWDGQVEVRWLLTNRKHGGKTESVSVLKAALKKNGGMGEKTEKLIVNGWEKKKEKEKKKVNKSDGNKLWSQQKDSADSF